MTAPPAAPATTRRHVVFVLACLTSFMLYLHRYTWNIIRPELQEQYGFSNTQLEAMGTAFYFTYAIGQIPSGMIVDLFGPHLFLTVSILVWAVAVPMHAMTGNLYGLGSVRLLFGAAQAGCYPALGQVTRTWFPLRIRTQVQGWVASFAGRGGGALSSVIMATILMGWYELSWQTALLVMAVPGVVFAAMFWMMFRNSPDEDPEANEAERRLIRGDVPVGAESRGVLPFREAMKNGTLRLMVLQQFMNAGADVVYTLVMGSYFVSLGVADMKQLGWLVSLPLIGGALGGVTGGILNDWSMRRFGDRRWARSGVGFSGKALAAVSLFFAVQLPTAAAVAYGLFLVKFFTDWTQPTVWGTCTDIGGRYSATVFSINNMSGNVGALVTPLIIGPLLDYFSEERVVDGVTETVTNFTPMFVLVGALYVGAGICWLFVDCTNEIRQDSASVDESSP